MTEYGASDFKIERHISSYLNYKIKKEGERSYRNPSKGKSLIYAEASKLIEGWIEDRRSMDRFAQRKKREAPQSKKETVLKIKVDPSSGKVNSLFIFLLINHLFQVKVKDGKMWKKMVADAKNYIRYVEAQHPHLFDAETFEKLDSTMNRKRFALREVGEEEQEIPRVFETYKTIRKKIGKEEAKDLKEKLYMLYTIVFILNRPTSEAEVLDFWSHIYTTVTPVSKRLIQNTLKDKSIFDRYKSRLVNKSSKKSH